MSGPLAQSAERGADNAKVVSSTLTRTNKDFFLSFLTKQNYYYYFLKEPIKIIDRYKKER